MRSSRSPVANEESDRTSRSPSVDPPSYDFSVALTPSISSSSSSNVDSKGSAGQKPPPIIRQSSSHLLRNLNASAPPSQSDKNHSSTPKVNNAPYRPAPELQRHIDSLSSTVSPLSSVTSNTHTEYFDILPSFQMFQSILKRDNDQFSENLTIDPPVYGDTSNSTDTPPGLSPQTSRDNSNNQYFFQQQRDNNLDSLVDGSVDSLNDRLNGHTLSPQTSHQPSYPPGHNPRHRLDDDAEYNHDEEGGAGGQYHPSNIAATHDTYGHTVLDNIDRLPKLHDSPIDIQIYVTKRIPHPHVANESETRLKEYSSGDVVNGYITIQNTSDKPVDFGLFIVTLEGTVKATERVNSKLLDAGKIKRVLMKKFLKMYDLNASYGYGYIPSSAGVEYEFLSEDTHDGSVLGIPDERVLQPQVKYKKFFTFKFPEKLLDNSCLNSVLSHVLPPPSMGLDRTCFYNRGASIALNKTLGYGFLNVRGTPLLTKDYAFEDVSVAYTIEAKFIDKLNAKDQKTPINHQDINDPNNPDPKNQYVISKAQQYFLRFIPDIKNQFGYYDQDLQFDGETYGTAGIDGKLFHNYLNVLTWRNVNELNYQIEREINLKLNHDEMTASDVKHKSLFNNNTVKTTNHLHNFNIKDQILRQLEMSSNRQLEADDNLYYHDERMIGSSQQLDIYGKKKKKILSSLIKIGTGKLFVRVPSKPIPYTSPKLLMKYNYAGGSAPTSPMLSPVTSADSAFHHHHFSLHSTQSRSIDGNIALSPVTSGASVLSNGSGSGSATSSTHMMELYHRNAQDIQDHLDITLVFRPLDNSTPPPKINYIEVNVVSWSYNTEYPLPFTVGYDFFYCSPKDQHVHGQDDSVERTRENFQQLKDQAFNYIHFLKANELVLTKESYLYLKSLKSLTFKKDTIKDYFQTLTQQSHAELLNNEHNWKGKQSASGASSSKNNQNLLWTKDIKVPLIPINKGNVNLIPSFQNCLVGRIYCLQVVVKYKGSGSEQKEFADNVLKIDVPVLVG